MLAAIERRARPHPHGDLHPRRRRGRPALRAGADRQAARRACRCSLIRDSVGTHRHAGGLLPAPGRRRHPGARVQPAQPAARAQGLGAEPARPPQAADRRRAHRLPRRHQHQQRVLGRLVQPALAPAQARRQPGLARHRPAAAAARWWPSCRSSSSPTWAAQKGAAAAPRRTTSRRPSAPGAQVVRAIGSSPDEPYSLIYATLLSAIGSAETSVHLTNAYFAPDPQLLAALEAAAARGVDVTADPAQPDRLLAGLPRRARLLRAAAARRREDLRAARRDPALEDRADRRRVGHRRLDQPRLAQLPAQPRAQRGGAGRRVRRASCRRCSTPTWPPRTRSRSSSGRAGPLSLRAKEAVRAPVGVLARRQGG